MASLTAALNAISARSSSGKSSTFWGILPIFITSRKTLGPSKCSLRALPVTPNQALVMLSLYYTDLPVPLKRDDVRPFA